MVPDFSRETIRERIMVQLVATFEAAPVAPLVLNWDVVTRDPVTATTVQNVDTALGLYDTTERVRERTGYEERFLNVVVEFHLRMAEDDVASRFLNHAIGEVVSRVGADLSHGGLAIDTKEAGNELDVDGQYDKYVSGVIVFEVRYRCRPNDPYTPV